MEFCKYKKDLNFSYTMGAFPTIELLQSKNYKTISVLVHSKYDDKAGLEKICDEKGINLIYNDKIVNKLQSKENTFVIGVFEKNFAKIKKDNHILLCEPRDKGNLGTILRTALGFGFKNIAIIDGCDVFDPKTVRASMGAIFKMNVEIFKNFEDYKKTFEENNIYSFILNKDSVSLKAVEIKKPFTLMFGNESHGLENFDLSGTTPVFIEQSEDIDSFNLPIASSIAMYKFTEKE